MLTAQLAQERGTHQRQLQRPGNDIIYAPTSPLPAPQLSLSFLMFEDLQVTQRSTVYMVYRAVYSYGDREDLCIVCDVCCIR
jgi:hypothetical protein